MSEPTFTHGTGSHSPPPWPLSRQPRQHDGGSSREVVVQRVVKEIGGSANYPILPRWLGDLPHDARDASDRSSEGDVIKMSLRRGKQGVALAAQWTPDIEGSTATGQQEIRCRC
uniref:Uncharacterized protein n=1 Tax=Oryza rufipogon TaxID=4529 RepID=A0A0E0PWV8_ORYRU